MENQGRLSLWVKASGQSMKEQSGWLEFTLGRLRMGDSEQVKEGVFCGFTTWKN